ncbi:MULTISPECIES: uroporphyrinogen-III synthase [Kitasatospora]|uniref:Putative transcriptional regulator n=1 Tax=Kitasatospora setae (strain ATCC 33774 / DSM 43861 / JCM 3304 / KCC A-0304 / NBRC 14216 / KM-6054) TaxID=452652 RepID=E4NBW3_KITSK|nr:MULTISPECIES: uroporphyrinogen-III synthase [Kitasatospora]BAJ28694.1 putative transcriptional regulator [Kitasatospora setae KM-6054]
MADPTRRPQDEPEPAEPEPAETGPLAGWTIGVTAARRAEELAALLQRRGAGVLRAPALRIVPLADDTDLHGATRALIADPPDLAVATTGIGFRGWLEAADGWDLGDGLRAALGRASVLARGPKAKGAIRAAGLRESYSAATESSAEVLSHLLEEGVDGLRIAVQLHGAPLPGFVESLRTAGADVVEVPVYRWLPPADLGPLDRLLDATCAGALDAVTFTSAPAAISLLDRAARRGRTGELLHALRRDVLAVCVGPVTSAPLDALDVPTVWPERMRLGAMVQTLTAALPARARRLPVAGHTLELRGQAALVDGRLRPVPPAGMALLRTLARHPGWVVPRADLLRALPGSGDDEHAVETAMARLRQALGAPRLITTVVKRGYRLTLDH